MKILIAFTITAALIAPVKADGPLTSRELYNACTTAAPSTPKDPGKNATGKQLFDVMSGWIQYHKQTKEIASCNSYILGVADGIGAFADLYSVKDCVPDAVMSNDMREIFVRFYNAHPQNRHEGAQKMVTAAFVDAYGCQFTNKEKSSW